MSFVRQLQLARRTVLLSTLIFAGGASVLAQTSMPTPAPATTPSIMRPVPEVSRVGVRTADELSLTLEQSIEMALKNNNAIESSRNDTKIAEFNLRSANGIYDPLINSQSFYESRTTPTASTIGGATNGSVTQRQFLSDLGLSGFVPKFGGSYDAIFTNSRTDTTNRNTTLNPQFPTSLVATFIQPLLRNRSIDNNRRTIQIARRSIELSEAELRLTATATVANVEQTYWSLAFALRNLQVQIDTLKQAREQLESNQRLVDNGVLAPIEIVAATAQITTFEQAIYTAQEAVTRAENNLKTLVLPNRAAPEWSRPLMPISPVAIAIPRISLEVATAEAIENRPEIDQFDTNEAINKIDEKFYRNQTKPQVDLVGSYTAAGLAGNPNPLSSGAGTVPPNLNGGYLKSLGNLLQQDYPTYRVGVQVSLPWGNRTAKANLGRTLVEGDKLGNARAQTEQAIEADVRNSLQALRSAEARLGSATAARIAADELYSSEQRQFRAGITTFFLVAQRQTELLAARSRELQAQTDLNIAVSQFNRAIGLTLTINNITLLK